MKIRYLLSLAVAALFSLGMYKANAQMGINATGAAIDPSAMLDVASTSKGMLVPRMSAFDITQITSPATGLLVYQTDGAAGFYYNGGTPAAPVWSAVGGNGLPAGGTEGQVLKIVGGLPTWVSVPPTLTTTAIGDITSHTASSGGNITSDGGAAVTARGLCWSSTPGPTVALATKTTDGAGTGSFVSSITGLTGSATYYVRAYATNSAGTTYGNELFFNTPISIGMSYQGGIVAYILQPGDPGYDPLVPHGLIAATGDQNGGSAIQWWNGSIITTGATGTAIGTGASNTNIIVTSQGVGSYAASICKAYNGGGYTDWYLPSMDELNTLYINKIAIGGFVNFYYWSSSEFLPEWAWGQFFGNGDQDDATKATTRRVRAVRSF